MTYFFHAASLAALSFIIYQLVITGRAIMSAQEQIDALTAQVSKITTEVTAAKDAILAHVADIEAQLAAAGAAGQVDLTGLKSAVQTLDDLNPDAVAPEGDPLPLGDA
jgi:hypothetical protein